MTTGPVPVGAADRRAKWLALGAGMLAQASIASLQQGLPALGPLLRETFGLSLSELGALLAAPSWGVMLTVYFWGWLADRRGERLVVFIGLGAATASLAFVTQAGSAVGLGIGVCLAGAMGGSAIAASGRAVMGWFPRSQRGLALGLRQMAVPLGAGLAAIVLPAAALRFGLPGAFSALALLSCAGAVLGLIALRPPPGSTGGVLHAGPAPSPIHDRAIWRLSCASGLMLWAQVSLNSFLVVILVDQQDLGYASAAGLFALTQALSGVARIFAGWLSDRRGYRVPYLIHYASMLAVLLLVSAVIQAIQSPFSVAVLTLTTIMAFSWNGLAAASIAELAGRSRAGSALGLHGTLMRALTIPAALVFGWVAGQANWAMSLGLLAIFPAAGALVALPVAAVEKARAIE